MRASKRKKPPKSDVPAVPLPDWRDDWLYVLVLQDAEETWSQRKREMERIGDRDDSRYWQYVLVEEFADSHDSMCQGDPIRAWTVDDNGVTEISLEELALHLREIRDRIYPFIMIEFHIHPDRKHVVLGHAEASTAGSGCVYRVDRNGRDAKLVPDESFGMWIS